MEGKKYLLGEVSEITGIHKDTLRFYDKIGLLKPRYVNPDNKYRYYTYDQFWSLDIITCCRSLNIPIKTIKAILASSSNDMVMELLHEHQRTALRLCAYYRKISEDIDWYMEQYEMIKHTNAKPRVTIKSLPPRQTLYGENPDDTHAYHLNLQKLCRKAMKQSDFIRATMDSSWMKRKYSTTSLSKRANISASKKTNLRTWSRNTSAPSRAGNTPALS